MHKVKRKLLPIYVVNIFEENVTRYQFCNENDFNIPRFSQSVRYGNHSLRYLGPHLWSTLSRVDKNTDKLNVFITINVRQQDLANLLEDNCENCHLCSL